MNRQLMLILVFAAGMLVSCRQTGQVLSAGAEETYTNPVLAFDYSDPDVVRTGDDYWMTASSFNCVPGLPILHSTDLVNWKIVNYALKKLYPEDFFSQPRHGKGVWAPCIRFHKAGTTFTGGIPISAYLWSGRRIRFRTGPNLCW